MGIDMCKLLRLLCPKEITGAVHMIEPTELGRRGIKALLVDLDNTLVPWQGYDVKQEVADWIRDLDGKGIKICIVSNTRKLKRLKQIAAELGVPFARKATKPRRGGFREALCLLEADCTQSAVIGDQIFTDILGGNRLGAHTILVSPLSKKEFAGTKISRLLERIILRILKKRGMLCSFHTEISDPGNNPP